MGFNEEFASRLQVFAKLLELTGANRFRINAFAKAARAIEKEPRDVATLDVTELTGIDGVGKGVAQMVAEFRETGTIRELNDLLDEIPTGLLEVMDVQGLGPKTVRQLWQELGVTSRDDLKRVIDDGSILGLPRMGQKTVDNILKALTFASKSSSRVPIGIAWPIADRMASRLRSIEGVRRVEVAGSLRRGKETIGDIDLLVIADEKESVRAAFCDADGVTDVIARGDTKCSVRMKIEVDGGRWNVTKDADGGTIGVDLRLVPADSFGAALMYFTGSKEHNVRLRELAGRSGLTLNEYGLFHDDGESAPHTRGIKPVSSESEASVYAELGVPFVHPELREDEGEFGETETPELVTTSDIKAELHAHTTESDGQMSLDELVQSALSRGFHTIAVTDHSRSSAQANGLSVDRLQTQRHDIERAREHFGDSIEILAGSEVDILADGALDYDDDVLASLDVVVASPHAALTQDGATATKRMLRAIEHPLVHVIGHPTGRLINRRPGLDLQMNEIIAAAQEHNVALEINSHWMRRDLRDHHARAAAAAGIPIAIDCDVHAPGDFDNIRFGVATARRAGLVADGCVNAWSRSRLRDWLDSKR